MTAIIQLQWYYQGQFSRVAGANSQIIKHILRAILIPIFMMPNLTPNFTAALVLKPDWLCGFS